MYRNLYPDSCIQRTVYVELYTGTCIQVEKTQPLSHIRLSNDVLHIRVCTYRGRVAYVVLRMMLYQALLHMMCDMWQITSVDFVRAWLLNTSLTIAKRHPYHYYWTLRTVEATLVPWSSSSWCPWGDVARKGQHG